MSLGSSIKLHLGCGKRHIPEFIHIDVDFYDHLDHRRDIKDLKVFSNGAADEIYVCHCFNYFDDDDARLALKEWRRVLKPGGILRIATPDFASIARHYALHRDIGALQRLVTGYYKGNGEPIYHRAVYDEASLTRLLHVSGFDQVRRYDAQQTTHAAIDDYSQAYLPHMDKENGLLMSLNLEAR